MLVRVQGEASREDSLPFLPIFYCEEIILIYLPKNTGIAERDKASPKL